MRDDSRVMEQRQLQTGKVRAQRILNPLKKSGTKNQKAAKDEQPVSRPELSGFLRPWQQALLPCSQLVSANDTRRLLIFMCFV